MQSLHCCIGESVIGEWEGMEVLDVATADRLVDH